MTLQKIEIDEDIALEVASHEAVIRQAYKDSVGKWTWSVGLTSASGHNVERYIGKPQPMQKCIDVYIWALRNYSKQVLEAFAGYHLTKNEFAAALSFNWNTGAIKRAAWVKSVKLGHRALARAQFMNWVTPKEITARRRAERDLFFDNKWSNNGTTIEYTKLTSRHRPVWSSAVRRDISREVDRAINIGLPTAILKPTAPMQLDAPLDAPTLTPSAVVDKPVETVYTLESFMQLLKRWLLAPKE